MFTKIRNWISYTYRETMEAVKVVPTIAVVFFVLSIVLMNQLAATSLVETSWLCLDSGIFVAWFSFLAMDVVVKTFGPKITNRLILFALVINVFCCLILNIPLVIDCIKTNDFSMDSFIAPFWVIGASAIAFLLSGIINTAVNHTIGIKLEHISEKASYAVRTYVSTALGQFLDNLVFGLLFTLPASIIGVWGSTSQTFIGIVGVAFVGAIVELLCEIIFSPVGFKISKQWEIEYINKDTDE